MAGLSYIEVLLATALIAITLVPAMEALTPALQGAAIHESQSAQQFHLAARLETLLAEPFASLDAEAVAINDPSVASTIYSDAAGDRNRRLVYLSRYDADNADADNDFFTGMDEGLVWLRVEIEGTTQAVESLTSQYE
jgi:hypothetical protein